MPVDSHCHLNYPGLAEEQAGVIARARAAGVTAMLNISTRASEWGAVIAIAEAEPDIWATVGIHPHEADSHAGMTCERLVRAAEHRRVVGIGETGLDYYYDKSDRGRQQTNFRRHIEAAREARLPIVIHTRDAEDDTLSILRDEMGKGAFKGVIHCFTASAAFGRAALDLGLYISISGIVTFRNAKELSDFSMEIPEDRLLVETDAPFLAPVPMRGKTCEPSFVTHTAGYIAERRGVSFAALDAITTDNFYCLFAKAVR